MSAVGDIDEQRDRRSLVPSRRAPARPLRRRCLSARSCSRSSKRSTKTLKLTVDYGWLTIISQPLFWLLSFVYGFVGNWGVAIILVTFLIKLAFYKLTESSGRSMAKMRNLQPRMKALQDRYKDDKQALSQAMMELYKREKVNPAAGCLPILIQMPFFLAFYWVLLESVEMRQAPFALWITDLSTRDPYFILPLIMGAAMFCQQKLNPAPADPVQAKVMQIMPIMFTVFFAFFPSGLVLYWVTNTLLSIAQQWNVNRVVEAETKAQKASKSGKKGSDSHRRAGPPTGGHPARRVRTLISPCSVLWTGQRSAISSMRARCASVRSPSSNSSR